MALLPIPAPPFTVAAAIGEPSLSSAISPSTPPLTSPMALAESQEHNAPAQLLLGARSRPQQPCAHRTTADPVQLDDLRHQLLPAPNFFTDESVLPPSSSSTGHWSA